MVTMEFFISATLALHIIPYHRFIPMLSDCAGKIPVTPKLTTPKHLLHMGTTSKHFSCRQTLNHLHYLFHAIGRNRLYQKNERGLYLCQSPKISFRSAVLFPDKCFEAPRPLLCQIPLACILPEKPGDTSIPLHCGFYVYTRSFTYVRSKLRGIEPQGI